MQIARWISISGKAILVYSMKRKPKQRTVATLGRLDQIDGQLDQVIAGLARVTGKPIAVNKPPAIVFESARAFGDV